MLLRVSDWFRTDLRRAVAGGAVLVSVAAGLMLAPSGAAKPTVLVTVRLVPGSISAGERVLAIVTFDNTGAGTARRTWWST